MLWTYASHSEVSWSMSSRLREAILIKNCIQTCPFLWSKNIIIIHSKYRKLFPFSSKLSNLLSNELYTLYVCVYVLYAFGNLMTLWAETWHDAFIWLKDGFRPKVEVVAPTKKVKLEVTSLFNKIAISVFRDFLQYDARYDQKS